MQTTSTSTLTESQNIRLANFVKKLMPSRSIFQERLNEAEMIEIIIDMFEPNEKLRSAEEIEDAELEEIIYDVMILKSVAGTLNDLTPQEIAKFDDAVKRQKYVG